MNDKLAGAQEPLTKHQRMQIAGEYFDEHTEYTGEIDEFAQAIARAAANPKVHQDSTKVPQSVDRLLDDWIDAAGLNPEMDSWHVSRLDIKQLIAAALSGPTEGTEPVDLIGDCVASECASRPKVPQDSPKVPQSLQGSEPVAYQVRFAWKDTLTDWETCAPQNFKYFNDNPFDSRETRALYSTPAAASQDAKDAARYRFLRDGGISDIPFDDNGLGPEYPRDDDFDSFVDRAIASMAGQTGESK